MPVGYLPLFYTVSWWCISHTAPPNLQWPSWWFIEFNPQLLHTMVSHWLISFFDFRSYLLRIGPKEN
nr:MAG TPA: hypothetical protein [Caudoviricetes sp.]